MHIFHRDERRHERKRTHQSHLLGNPRPIPSTAQNHRIILISHSVLRLDSGSPSPIFRTRRRYLIGGKRNARAGWLEEDVPSSLSGRGCGCCDCVTSRFQVWNRGRLRRGRTLAFRAISATPGLILRKFCPFGFVHGSKQACYWRNSRQRVIANLSRVSPHMLLLEMCWE